MEIKTGLLPNASNYRQGRVEDIKYIVIHYTGNKGDTALNNVKYFANNVTKTSAHFFVDENNIYTSVPASDTAWHCGGGLQGSKGHEWYGICKNSNSIGIELCLMDKNGNVRRGTVDSATELTRYIMKKYNIGSENVIRHFDVTGKNCPMPYVAEPELWKNFKAELEEKGMSETEHINYIIDLIGKDISEIKQHLDRIEKENSRQNEIINLIGQDIEELKKR